MPKYVIVLGHITFLDSTDTLRLSVDEKKVVEAVMPAKLLSVYTLEKGNHTNLLCVKKPV